MREDTGGMGPRPCLHGGRLCACIHEGMGPRIREDTGGHGFPSLSSQGQSLRRHSRGDGSPHPRGHEWGWVPVPIFTGSVSAPTLTRAWVSACARTRGGRLHPHPSLPPLKGEGKREGMGPRIREDTGGEDFTPILAFPPQGGREKRGDGSPSLSSRGAGSSPAFTRGWVPASGDLCITTETHSYSGVGRLLP